jgi:RNA polymerase sigma factor (sigma-70 family)
MNRVLLVDDDDMILAGLSALLELENIPATVAGDRESAEALMEEQFFPLVLADLRLRDGDDGLMLIEAIRRISPASKIAAMTGFATPELDARALSVGAEIVLHKPFFGEEFIEAVKALLASVPDPEDLESVYAATTPRLRAMVSRRFHLSPADCEDLIQQAWCVVLEKRAQVREIGPFLAGTVMNLARQTLSRQMRESDLEAVPEARSSFSSDPTPTLAVRGALTKLDARSRTLCELIAVEQLSYAEVGAQLSMPVGSIGPLYIRAKQRLKKELMN